MNTSLMFGLPFLLTGIVLGILIALFSTAEFDTSINIVELGNLLFVVALAVLVPYFIDRPASDRRVEKDFIIEDLKTVLSELKKVNNTVSSQSLHNDDLGEEGFRLCLSSIKNARAQISIIQNHIRGSHLRTKSNEVDNVKDLTFQYWSVVTEEISPNSSVTRELAKSESVLFGEINMEIRKLIFSINYC